MAHRFEYPLSVLGLVFTLIFNDVLAGVNDTGKDDIDMSLDICELIIIFV